MVKRPLLFIVINLTYNWKSENIFCCKTNIKILRYNVIMTNDVHEVVLSF